MQLLVKRKYFTDESTIGELYVNGVFECFTLEDKDRELVDTMSVAEIEKAKVKTKTAIPRGTYPVYLSPSGIALSSGARIIDGVKQCPGIGPVKGYSGIRIHRGTKATHTEGCLLLGDIKGTDSIGASTAAHTRWFDKFLIAWNAKETITITYVKEVVTDTRQLDGTTPQTDPPAPSNTSTPTETTQAPTEEVDENQKKNLQALFDEINNNQANIEAGDVNVSWGKRNALAEKSDWIALKQFLLYLCTRYVPQTVLPFVELIPLVSVDKSRDANSIASDLRNLGYDRDGKTPEELKEIYSKQSPQNQTLIDKLLKTIADPLPPGYDQGRFNLGAETSNRLSGQTDLFGLDPWQEGYKTLTELSDSGKIVYSQRATGIRIYSQLVFNPEPIAGVPSKPGAIGFTHLEVKAGSQTDNGLAIINMTLLDVQGNKFTDINSPWAFIFDSRPGSEGGDFYFRFGWELRLPDPPTNPASKGDLISQRFWNHPGWEIFQTAKTDLINGLLWPDNKIFLTHSINDKDVLNQNLLFQTGITHDETTGEINAERALLDSVGSPFVRLSILNPELSVDSVTGAVSAKLSFMTTGALVQMVPVTSAVNTKRILALGKVMTLRQLLVAFESDCIQNGVLSVSNPAKEKFLKVVAQRKQELLTDLINGQSSPNVIVIGADANSGLGGGNVQIDPGEIIIKVSKSLNNDLNEEDPSQTKTLIRWFRQVLEENDCVLLSTASGSGAGLNSKYIITTTQNIEENHNKLYEYPRVISTFDENNPPAASLRDLLAREQDVFSFRFQGSLVETLEVAKTDSTNSAAIAANFSLNDEATSESNPDTNDTKGAIGPIATTAADRQRNLLAIYAQMQNVNITCMAHPWLSPGQYIYVKGMGFFDGRYQVLSVVHTLEKHKFMSTIEAARILPSSNNTDTSTNNKQDASANGKTNVSEPTTQQYAKGKQNTKNRALKKAKGNKG